MMVGGEGKGRRGHLVLGPVVCVKHISDARLSMHTRETDVASESGV